MSPTAKRLVHDAVDEILNSLDTPRSTPRRPGRPKSEKHEPTLSTKPIVGRALGEAIDLVISAINDGRRSLGERGAPPVPPEVRQAWHLAAVLILDALGETGAVLQKRRRRRPPPPPPDVSKLTPEYLESVRVDLKKRRFL